MRIDMETRWHDATVVSIHGDTLESVLPQFHGALTNMFDRIVKLRETFLEKLHREPQDKLELMRIGAEATEAQRICMELIEVRAAYEGSFHDTAGDGHVCEDACIRMIDDATIRARDSTAELNKVCRLR